MIDFHAFTDELVKIAAKKNEETAAGNVARTALVGAAGGTGAVVGHGLGENMRNRDVVRGWLRGRDFNRKLRFTGAKGRAAMGLGGVAAGATGYQLAKHLSKDKKK